MADKYKSFADLAKAEKEGVDFKVERRMPKSSVAFIAPHGGAIEPMTAELADALAGHEHRYYAFRGTKGNGNGDLHITSTNFDEERCLEIIKGSKTVVAVHGLKDSSTSCDIEIGGRNAALRKTVLAALKDAGFHAKIATDDKYGAASPQNICNRGDDTGGVQLELSASLRARMKDEPQAMQEFVEAVRRATVDDP